MTDFFSFNNYLRIIFADILLENNGFLLHASSIEHGGCGYIFTGPEGAGKSTISNLFPKQSIRGDDVALIRKIRNVTYLYGSPFYQKTKRAYPNTKTPITGIFTLTQAEFNLIQRIPTINTPKILIENSLIGANTRINMLLLFTNTINIVKDVNMFNIWFYPKGDICDLVYKSSKMLKHHINSHHLSRILPNKVYELLPKNIIWTNALTSINQLKKFYILKDLTWNFELNSHRLVSGAAAILKNPSYLSWHKERILELLRKPNNTLSKKVFICLCLNDKITIIDGNHTAIALTISSPSSRLHPNREINIILGFSDMLPEYPFIN